MTQRRIRGNADPHYVPDEGLIERYALTYGWEPSKLTAALIQFGRLPKSQQEQLIRCLVQALGRYKMLGPNVQHVTPSEQQKQLKSLEKTAKSLLLQLGINPSDVPRLLWDRSSDRPPSERLRSLGQQNRDRMLQLGVMMQLTTAGIVIPDRDEAVVNAALREASNTVAEAVITLLSLHDRTKTAAQAVAKRILRGRGGSRRHPQAKGQLIRDAISIYAQMRQQHPNSGNKPGYGGPMLRFIHSVATLYGARVSDADIRDVWRFCKPNRK